ncbi:MAG: hypothetical protein ACK5JU_07975 [Bacteroidales bacterium]
MFNMVYDIQIGNYKLGLLQSVEIHKSVDLLADTAVVVVPGVVYNQSLDIETKVAVGDPVVIRLGYNDNLVTEFEGYLQRIDTDDNSITFICEDGIYLMRKPVKDIQLIKPTVKKIAEYCLSQIGLSELNCTYDISFEKFVIRNANAYDVLKKLQADTKANIYMKGMQLNIHPAYIEKGGDVIYDFAINVEKSDLKYRNSSDRKFEVVVEGIGLDGKKKTVTVGTTGGEKRTVKVFNVMGDAALKQRGQEELKYLTYTGYEGSITGWLIPYVEPTYSVAIRDKEYEYKNGTYYAVSVTTSFSEEGGSRKVELGRKLTGNG